MIFLRVALVALSLVYPLAVYFGLRHFDARTLVLLLVTVAGLRLISEKNTAINQRLWIPLLALLVFWILLSNSDTALKLYPLVLNVSFFTMFAWSLKHPPTVVERMARLRRPDLPPHARAYTTSVTKVWCMFFLLNGAISLATALWASDALWALYNGLIAYGLIGLLFAGEWLVRQRVMRLADE